MIRSIINKLPISFRNAYRHTWRAVCLEIKIAAGKIGRVLRRPTFPVNDDGSVNLHLGCGSIDHRKFINIDAIPGRHVHYVQPIDRLSNFSSETVDLIYACHCLEHFSHRRVPYVLREWHRVLKKGGILRLSVPDFRSMVDAYLAGERDIGCVQEPVTGGQDHKYNYHKTIFDEAYLKALLIDAGFTVTRHWLPGSSDMTTFGDWSEKTIQAGDRTFPLSLNIEAVK